MGCFRDSQTVSGVLAITWITSDSSVLKLSATYLQFLGNLKRAVRFVQVSEPVSNQHNNPQVAFEQSQMDIDKSQIAR